MSTASFTSLLRASEIAPDLIAIASAISGDLSSFKSFRISTTGCVPRDRTPKECGSYQFLERDGGLKPNGELLSESVCSFRPFGTFFSSPICVSSHGLKLAGYMAVPDRGENVYLIMKT